MTVITGMAGVGKTTFIRKSKIEHFIELDAVVKNVFFKRNFKLYWDVKRTFGKEYVSFRKVKTTQLASLVFNDKKELAKLNKIVKPYIKTYLTVLKSSNSDYFVEMATYLNDEKTYKKFFDKVILIDGEPNKNHRFSYLTSKYQPVVKHDIKATLVIPNSDPAKAVEMLNSLVK